MRRLLIYSVVIVIGGGLLFFIKGDNSVKDFGINLLAASFIIVLELIIENYSRISLFIQTRTKYRNIQIRFSVSYLYQIEVLGKYLLVKGNRIDQYQPVGGVYKRYRESFYQLRKLKVTDDNSIPIDDKSQGDLRIRLIGSNVTKFLKWFNSQLGREVSPHREFHEELISTQILDQSVFPYPNYIYLYRHQTPIHWSDHFSCYEILIADIFKLMPNESQIAYLKEMMSKNSEHFLWVSSDDIRDKGARLGVKISETSNWTL